MVALWWAWRSLHVGERWLLAASLLLMAFCGGASWQKYFYHQAPQPILQESSQAKLIQWDSRASMIVDVSGKVVRPGIVHLPRGARVKDAIQKAGGVLPGANVSTLNFAAALSDGEQVQVDPASGKSTFIANKSAGTKININQADEAELQSLPHIGPVMAARIVAYRKSHGAFQNLDDLNAVQGIGAKTIEKLQPLITFH